MDQMSAGFLNHEDCPDPRLPGPCPASEDLAEPSATPVPGMPLPGCQEHVKMTWLGMARDG